jgi:hypothetical protein
MRREGSEVGVEDGTAWDDVMCRDPVWVSHMNITTCLQVESVESCCGYFGLRGLGLIMVFWNPMEECYESRFAVAKLPALYLGTCSVTSRSCLTRDTVVDSDTS